MEQKIKSHKDALRFLMEYESDTFSASGAMVNQKEVEQVLWRKVDQWMSNNFDGVQFDAIIDEIREAKQMQDEKEAIEEKNEE